MSDSIRPNSLLIDDQAVHVTQFTVRVGRREMEISVPEHYVGERGGLVPRTYQQMREIALSAASSGSSNNTPNDVRVSEIMRARRPAHSRFQRAFFQQRPPSLSDLRTSGQPSLAAPTAPAATTNLLLPTEDASLADLEGLDLKQDDVDSFTQETLWELTGGDQEGDQVELPYEDVKDQGFVLIQPKDRGKAKVHTTVSWMAYQNSNQQGMHPEMRISFDKLTAKHVSLNDLRAHLEGQATQAPISNE